MWLVHWFLWPSFGSLIWMGLCASTEGQTYPLGPLVGCGWLPVMSKDGILVAELSVSWVLSRHETCNIPLWPFLVLDGWLEGCDPISRMVMLDPSASMIKFRLYSSKCYGIQVSKSFLIGARKWWQRVNRVKRNCKIIFLNILIQMKSYMQRKTRFATRIDMPLNKSKQPQLT